MPAVLALDFDGVVSDSAPESYVVACRALAALRGDSAPETGRPAPAREAVLADPTYAEFVRLMPLGNRAEDYAVVLEAIRSGTAVPDQTAYDARRRAVPEAFVRDFHRRFYQERRALAEGDTPGWHALMGPYTPLLPILRRRASDTRLAIATAKDHASVEALLEHYGIADLFDAAAILDKETGVSKTAHLRRLQALHGVAWESILFVDDKLNHLEDVATLGVRCALAAWGYNGPREADAARRQGHLVCHLEDFEAQVFGSGPASALGRGVEPA